MGIDFIKILSSLWQVLAVGVLLGAGLPALFSLGMRSLVIGRIAPDGSLIGDSPTTLGRAGAYVCFGLTILAAVGGIIVIVFGKQIFGGH